MKTYQNFLSENFQFLEVKFSIYLNRRVFVMIRKGVFVAYANNEEPDQPAKAYTQQTHNVATTS